MGHESVLKPALTALFFIVACYASFNAFYYPNPGNLDSTLSLKKRPKRIMIKSPVKVYMYELPRRFTYGVIESYSAARRKGPKIQVNDHDSITLPKIQVNDHDSITLPKIQVNDHDSITLPKYPGNQYSAEWYLFSDLQRPDRFVSGSGSSIERVLDPKKADLFYVPFFSSLSLVVNQNKPGSGPAMYSDEDTQEGLVEWLEEQVYWKRNNGWDHIFPCEDPSALNKVVDRVKNGVLLVSDFWRLRQDEASLVKDVILPYSHRIRTFVGEVGVESRKSLLFFMGNRYRKEGGKIRDMLFQILEKEDDVIIKHGAQSIESRRIASQGMHTSKFCLHPAGDTPSACRLFDAIVSLCIPIIVSDYIELPFEDVINYRKIAIFVDTNTALKPGFLVNFLRNEVSSKRIVEFQKEMIKVRHYFEYDDPNGTVNEIWRQVSRKLPLIKLMIHRERRLIKKKLAKPDCSCLCSNHTEPMTNV